MRFGAFGLIVLASACVRSTPPASPPPPPAPTPVDIPPGCEAALGGPWQHSEDPTYLYEGDDDGGTLTLRVSRRAALDAGFHPRRFRRDAGPSESVDAGLATDLPATVVELRRTSTGFFGDTLATVPHPSGRACEVRFPTRVLACGDAGLILETSAATALGDSCQAPASPLEVPRQQHTLRRPE